MGKVTTGGTMSLDGYIAGPEESGFDLLFQWYGNGDVEIPSASPDVPPPRISAASAELIRPEWENTGALVVGRHLYDMTNAWGGRHPMNVTTVVLTHRRPDDRPEDDENSSSSQTASRRRWQRQGAGRGQGRRCQRRADGPTVPGGRSA